MLTWIKRIVVALLLLVLLGTASIYGLLALSLPALDGKGSTSEIDNTVTVARDAMGQAVVSADTRADASYGLGFAHGQDRFFQMDLLRRNAAGELSELFGSAAIGLDESMRFHQFRKRAKLILMSLPEAHRQILERYTQGVNDGRVQSGFTSFEYLLLGATPAPWQPEDSLLTIFSMYLDLQAGTYERDETLIALKQQYGQDMLDFILQPSQYQAALDNSVLTASPVTIPALQQQIVQAQPSHIADVPLYGSNNWAVTGALTKTGSAMLSDDMHLGLNVPSIWYRAQLNYQDQGHAIQVTGVSLPGAPAIVVGSNNRIAWGFTNGYLDTADWIELDADTKTQFIAEEIKLPDGKSHTYQLEMSTFGPVKQLGDKKLALSWVAHQPYAVNLELVQLECLTEVQQATEHAKKVGIPVQNLMVVDSKGAAAWTPMGAIPARKMTHNTALNTEQYEQAWQNNEQVRPVVQNPENGKLWTANSRVVSVADNQRFGDGGYALGARAVQIRDGLLAQQQFTEADFYQLQLDNRAKFLAPWHEHLVSLLQNQHSASFENDISLLNDWQGCACAGSVGYTLVKAYRNALIDTLFAPLEQHLNTQKLSLKPVKRYLEPGLWQLLTEQPNSWLGEHGSWVELELAAYKLAKQKLSERYGSNMAAWRWGDVNALKVQHPFSKQMPMLSGLLDMPTAQAFGDTFMPAVQGKSFGASQRFIAQPGHLQNAILTVAGGQSGHPLSPFYRSGFADYAEGENTPLLPGELTHQIVISPK
ncbi:penicillin acylase family protein [Pseudoalteromonas sp. OANN1]|uniref:penicillin acylase family protein n=1 Tax=Pseudoalteromonas sp. OANN1 TaxID=2954497 RepID=UPI002097E4DB|nr:penicillin acylase family protein [Pseudoalteromonas sp. OANN1]MCO7201416.1 penicillin acylase family protein [Pseudoalteromonas sp. OANN1]